MWLNDPAACAALRSAHPARAARATRATRPQLVGDLQRDKLARLWDRADHVPHYRGLPGFGRARPDAGCRSPRRTTSRRGPHDFTRDDLGGAAEVLRELGLVRPADADAAARRGHHPQRRRRRRPVAAGARQRAQPGRRGAAVRRRARLRLRRQHLRVPRPHAAAQLPVQRRHVRLGPPRGAVRLLPAAARLRRPRRDGAVDAHPQEPRPAGRGRARASTRSCCSARSSMPAQRRKLMAGLGRRRASTPPTAAPRPARSPPTCERGGLHLLLTGHHVELRAQGAVEPAAPGAER